MDAAIHSVFAALVWHTQEMREAISTCSKISLAFLRSFCVT